MLSRGEPSFNVRPFKSVREKDHKTGTGDDGMDAARSASLPVCPSGHFWYCNKNSIHSKVNEAAF